MLVGRLAGTKNSITKSYDINFVKNFHPITFIMIQLFSPWVLLNSTTLWSGSAVEQYDSKIIKHLFNSCRMYKRARQIPADGYLVWHICSKWWGQVGAGGPEFSSPGRSYNLACPPNHPGVRLPTSWEFSHVLLAAPKCLSTVMSPEGWQINTSQTPPQSKQPL